MDRGYCAACGETVEVVVMTRGVGFDAKEEPRCINCGLLMADPPRISAGVPFPRVAVADDAESLRKAVAEDLRSLGLASSVELFVDGAQFASTVNERAALGRPFDLVVLDLHMPVFDGLKAARFLRNLETQLRWEPVPILFFSSIVCDERLRQALTLLRPCSYLNKGSVGMRSNLPMRLERILGQRATR